MSARADKPPSAATVNAMGFAILAAIGEDGPRPVSDLATITGRHSSTVGFAIEALQTLGLITAARPGRRPILWALTPLGLNELERLENLERSAA